MQNYSMYILSRWNYDSCYGSKINLGFNLFLLNRNKHAGIWCLTRKMEQTIPEMAWQFCIMTLGANNIYLLSLWLYVGSWVIIVLWNDGLFDYRCGPEIESLKKVQFSAFFLARNLKKMFHGKLLILSIIFSAPKYGKKATLTLFFNQIVSLI